MFLFTVELVIHYSRSINYVLVICEGRFMPLYFLPLETIFIYVNQNWPLPSRHLVKTVILHSNQQSFRLFLVHRFHFKSGHQWVPKCLLSLTLVSTCQISLWIVLMNLKGQFAVTSGINKFTQMIPTTIFLKLFHRIVVQTLPRWICYDALIRDVKNILK